MATIDAYLRTGREKGASDVHLSAGLPPGVRVDGELVRLEGETLTAEAVEAVVAEILDDGHREDLGRYGAVDLSYAAGEAGRFRVTVCRQRLGLSVICRVIPDAPPALKDLALPSIVPQLCRLNAGLILVTGSTGTGKSTTLAAIIDEINRTRNLSILTLEDPVEFVHPSQKSQVLQREVGVHVNSFGDGLRAALREDPDVILVGELRDLETMSLAIEASETGHLVLGTLHTRGAPQTIHRIVDAYPTEAQAQIRHTLADSLKCVLSQELVRLADGRGRRAVMEVLVMTPAVSQHVREGKLFQVPQAMATGKRFGMQLMDQALLALVRSGDIDPNEAFLRAVDKKEFTRFVTDPELAKLAERAPAGNRAA